MSVFKSIKNTLFNVQQDVSSGLKSLTKRQSQDESVDEEEEYEVHGLDLDAGAQLLQMFQENWSDMHLKSEENAKQAKALDGQVSELFLYLERQNDAISQFLNEVSILPSLVQDVQVINDKIEYLEGKFESVEKELLEFEDMCEQHSLVKNEHHHNYQLAMYQQKKNVELEQLKVRMAAEHADKVKQFEKRLQRSLREKQEAFEATYREEIKHYKQFGKTSESFKPASPTHRVPDLAEIPVGDDGDQSALDEFLQSDETVQSAASEQSRPKDTEAGEEAEAENSTQIPKEKTEVVSSPETNVPVTSDVINASDGEDGQLVLPDGGGSDKQTDVLSPPLDQEKGAKSEDMAATGQTTDSSQPEEGTGT